MCAKLKGHLKQKYCFKAVRIENFCNRLHEKHADKRKCFFKLAKKYNGKKIRKTLKKLKKYRKKRFDLKNEMRGINVMVIIKNKKLAVH
jgi:hypothetical protein